MSCQVKNINKKIEIVGKNQIETTELKNTKLQMKKKSTEELSIRL
jgi:hypothetical protein